MAASDDDALVHHPQRTRRDMLDFGDTRRGKRSPADDSIQRGPGSRFSAFPAENATGNFIKIVQRVPVKILIDSGLKNDEPVPLGVSVVPTVVLK